MNKMCKGIFLTSAMLVCYFSLSFMTSTGYVSAGEPIPVIFDTDLGNDIDDTMALAMCHALTSRGDIKLLGVTSTKDNPYVAVMISLVNQFYGYPDVPIGVATNNVTTDDGLYIRKVSEMTNDNGLFLFPRNVAPESKLLTAVTLIRKLLSEAQDNSVVIVQVGFFSNLAYLLDTPGDEYSPLSGPELIKQKVNYVSIMAGSFVKTYHQEFAEYNVGNDLPAAKKVFQQWPTKMILSGFEIGMALEYPGRSMQNDFNYVPFHPVKEAYRFYRGLENAQPTWDLNSVLHVVSENRGYYDLSPPGKVTADDLGVTSFEPMADGLHYYQIVNEEQIARVREALIQLTSQPNK